MNMISALFIHLWGIRCVVEEPITSITLSPLISARRGATIIRVESPIEEEESDHRDSHYGIGKGLSEVDFMVRQRYLENSRLQSAFSHTLSIASQPAIPSQVSSSNDLCQFIQQQRKIISTFRAQPWPMQVKLAALRSYRKNVSKYVPHLNTLDTFRDSSGQIYRKIQRKFNAVLQYLTIWGTIIKKIEGNFGTSVASFFTFLRWLCALNLLLMVLIFGFVVVPQLISGHGLAVPESVIANGSGLISYILDGKGYAFEYSVLFYGYYDSGQNESYVPPPANPDPYIGHHLHYKLPLGYLLTMVAIFVICTLAILFSMAEKYKLLERANASEQYPFSWKVFVSWDFAITDPQTAAAKKKNITISLKETIVEAKKKEKPKMKIRLMFWTIRAITNSIVFIFLVGSSYAIVLAVQNAKMTNVEEERNIQSALDRGWNGLWKLIISFQVQIVIIARNFLIPHVFTLVHYCERFHPRTALKMMLLRMFFLYFSSLYVLMIALFALTDHCGELSDNTETCCWETRIGQELYKLTLTHFLADLASIILMDGTRWVISKLDCNCCLRFNKWYNKWIGQAQFRLAENILKLVYGQALLLFGILFCPLLAAINFVKNVLLFYCKAISVHCFNKPPRALFRAASTRNFYMALLLVTVLLCALPVGYAIVQMTPSHSCGPFRGHTDMIQVVYDEVENWPNFLQIVFNYLQRPAIQIPLVSVLGIVIYYYAARSQALKELNKDLSLQLRVEQNETRQRVAKKAEEEAKDRPQSVKNHRHQELQRALQEELNHHMATSSKRGSTLQPNNLSAYRDSIDDEFPMYNYSTRRNSVRRVPDPPDERVRRMSVRRVPSPQDEERLMFDASIRKKSVRRVPSLPIASDEETSFIDPPRRVSLHSHR